VSREPLGFFCLIVCRCYDHKIIVVFLENLSITLKKWEKGDFCPPQAGWGAWGRFAPPHKGRAYARLPYIPMSAHIAPGGWLTQPQNKKGNIIAERNLLGKCLSTAP
jgi:hypothetical protein